LCHWLVNFGRFFSHTSKGRSKYVALFYLVFCWFLYAKSGWWQLKDFGNFSRRKLRKIFNPFWLICFSKEFFNHQLDICQATMGIRNGMSDGRPACCVFTEPGWRVGLSHGDACHFPQVHRGLQGLGSQGDQWKKTLYINNGIFSKSTGAGFLPSTVVLFKLTFWYMLQ